MDAFLTLSLILVIFLVLGAAAMAFGEDSRDTIDDDHERGRVVPAGGLR